MAAIANVVLPDAATTPVNHTFAPSSVNGDQGNWANQAASLPIGFETISVSLTDPSGSSSVYLAKVSMKLPVLKTTTDVGGNSVTSVDYFTDISMSMKIPARSTLQARKDARKLFVGLLNDAQSIAVIENLQHVY